MIIFIANKIINIINSLTACIRKQNKMIWKTILVFFKKKKKNYIKKTTMFHLFGGLVANFAMVAHPDLLDLFAYY